MPTDLSGEVDLPTCVKLTTNISGYTELERKPNGGAVGLFLLPFIVLIDQHVRFCFALLCSKAQIYEDEIGKARIEKCDQYNFRILKADGQVGTN